MTPYRVRVRTRRHTHPRLGNEGISQAGIEWLIPDAVLVGRQEIDSLHVDVALCFDHEDHLEAANEVIVALQRLGYSVINLEVDELIDRATETMILSALGVGGTAQVKAKNPLIALIAALGGGFVGRLVGSQMKQFETIYRLVPSASGWRSVPVEPPEFSREHATVAPQSY